MMSDEWRHATLGSVLRPVSRPVDVVELDTVPFAGVRWYAQGVYHRADEPAVSVKTKRLNRLRRRDITYNRMWATKGAFGVVGPEADGCLVTNDFPIFEAQPDLIPEYLGLVFQWRPFQESAAALATGTTERRRLKEDMFVSLFLPLPQLGVQLRIVDLIGAFDAHISRVAVEVEALLTLRAAVARHHFATQPVRPLGNVVHVLQGKSLPLELQGTQSGPIPWYKLSDMLQPGNEFGYCTAASSFDAEGLAAAGGFVHPAGTVCFARVGAAVKTEKKRLIEVAGALDENHIALQPVSPEDGDYLLCVMEGIRLGEHVRSGAVPSLNQGLVKALKVPWSNDSAERRELSALWGSMRQTIRGLSQEAAQLRQFRTFLLSALFSRDVVLPETYDRVMDAGVA